MAIRAHFGDSWLCLLWVNSLRTVVPAGRGGPGSGCEAGRGALAQTHHLSLVYQVLPDGTYVTLGTAQSNYLAMVVSRVELLLGEIVPLLQKACVIAIRYSVIRRQSQLRPRQGAPRGGPAQTGLHLRPTVPGHDKVPSTRAGCWEQALPLNAYTSPQTWLISWPDLCLSASSPIRLCNRASLALHHQT